MAFDSLKGEKIYVSQTARTFIIGDYLAVFEGDNDIPTIYEWNSVKLFSERLQEFTFTMNNGEIYSLPKAAFADHVQIIRFRSIVEGQLPQQCCKLSQRIIPPKYNYYGVEMPEKCYSATGIYNEKDINTGSAANIQTKASKIIFFIGTAVAVVTFIILCIALGELPKSWYYYAPISVFTGIGCSVILHIILGIISRFRYSDFVKYDISSMEEMVIVVSSEGFAATESCVYTGSELIPWTNSSYQFETKTTIVIVCKDGYACWIPKRLFPKKEQSELAAFIVQRTHSR